MVAIGAADSTSRETEPLLSIQQRPCEPKHAASQASVTPLASMSDLNGNTFSSSWRFRIRQVVLVISSIMYTAAYMLFPSSIVQLVYLDRLADWWTEPARPPNNQPTKHLDMGRPTFLVVFGVLPFAIGTLALEAMRGPQNLHRIVSRQVLQVGVVLRRKPSACAAVPYLETFSIGELVFLAFLLGGNLVLFVVGWICMRHYYPLPGEAYTIYTTLQLLGVVLGYNCVYNMAFLFLPATRNSAWMEFMGISYANGMKFHRWLGVATVVTAVGHALPFYPIWYHNGQLWDQAMPCFDCSLDYTSKGYPAWFNVFGEISLFFMLVLAATSLPWIRRKFYETFYYAHYTFVPVVVFAILHWNLIAWWLLPTFTIYLVDRIVGSTNAMAPVSIEEVSALGDGIVKVVAARTSQRGGDFEVGQYVYMNVPAISKWQWHAFTIGSSPRASATSFTIWLKALGNWTDDFVKLAQGCEQKHEQPTVYIDGYYGASLESYRQYSTLCLVGGGIGATPLFAMLEDLASRASTWPTSQIRQRVHFVFSFREVVLLEEIHPVLQRLRACDHAHGFFTFEFYLTRLPPEEQLNACLAHCSRSTKTTITKQSHGCRKHPFTEPLRSRASRIVLYATVFFTSAALIVFLDYNGGVLMDHGAKSQYWPLQNFVDCLVLFVTPLVAYLFVFADRMQAGRRPKCESRLEISSTNDVRREAATTTDLVTYHDLLAEYNVSVGQRPDLMQAMSTVHTHLVSSRNETLESDVLWNTVGVFISGPEALKRATEKAVQAIDDTAFDIHDEEFEL